jgi:phosphatidate cytidylyltransferase
MHLKRLIVAAVLLPCIYLYVMYLPEQYFLLLLITISLMALSEFYSMYRVSGILKYACLLLGIIIVVTAYFSPHLLLDIIFGITMIILCIRLFAKHPYASLADLAPPLVGLFYVSGLLSFQAQIRRIGPEWIIFLYVTVWAADSAAYYIGKGIGKRRLYREVSPNKTVAGAIGSLIGGALGALILSIVFLKRLDAVTVGLIGVLIGFITIIGDLVESMFKRDAGAKDSGIIIPGHGGILDKIDGALFAGPILYWVLNMIKIAR